MNGSDDEKWRLERAFDGWRQEDERESKDTRETPGEKRRQTVIILSNDTAYRYNFRRTIISGGLLLLFFFSIYICRKRKGEKERGKDGRREEERKSEHDDKAGSEKEGGCCNVASGPGIDGKLHGTGPVGAYSEQNEQHAKKEKEKDEELAPALRVSKRSRLASWKLAGRTWKLPGGASRAVRFTPATQLEPRQFPDPDSRGFLLHLVNSDLSRGCHRIRCM